MRVRTHDIKTPKLAAAFARGSFVVPPALVS
jgi:hypothetical protein